MDAKNAVPADTFIGVDPDDTLEVPYGGGQFTLGVMPIGMWDRLNARQMAVFTNTKRAMIKKMTDEGRNPEEMLPSGSGTQLSVEVLRDDSFMAAMFGIRYDAVRFGLVKVEGVSIKGKGPLALERKTEKVDGFPCLVVTEQSMRFFQANSACLEALWSGFRKLHDLDDAAKKA